MRKDGLSLWQSAWGRASGILKGLEILWIWLSVGVGGRREEEGKGEKSKFLKMTFWLG